MFQGNGTSDNTTEALSKAGSELADKIANAGNTYNGNDPWFVARFKLEKPDSTGCQWTYKAQGEKEKPRLGTKKRPLAALTPFQYDDVVKPAGATPHSQDWVIDCYELFEGNGSEIADDPWSVVASAVRSARDMAEKTKCAANCGDKTVLVVMPTPDKRISGKYHSDWNVYAWCSEEKGE